MGAAVRALIGRESARASRYAAMGGILLCAALSMVFMRIAVGHIPAFWFDELVSLNFASNPSLPKAVAESVSTDGNGLLFQVLLFFWYRAAPFGERWLLILPECFAAASVAVIGFAARRVFGNLSGVFAALVMLGATFLLRYGNELRSYSLTALLVSILVYAYLVSDEKSRSRVRSVVLFALLFAALAYTFIFNAFVLIGVFGADAIRAFRGKLSKSALCAYPLAFLLYLPYLIAFFAQSAHIQPGAQYVMPLADIWGFAVVLWDGNIVFLYMFIYGVCAAVVLSIRGKSKTAAAMLPICALSVLPILMFYGVNRFWVAYFHSGFNIATRYTIACLPPMVLMIAYTFTLCRRFAGMLSPNHAIPNVAMLLLILAVGAYSITLLQKGLASAPKHYWEDRKYADAAQWAAGQAVNGAGEAAVCFITPDDPALRNVYRAAANGWYQYYLTRQGTRRGFGPIGNIYDALGYDTVYTFENQCELTSMELGVLESHFSQVLSNDAYHVKAWKTYTSR